MDTRQAPVPLGRIMRTPTGRNLILRRRLHATIEETWAAITESDRTERWFASWHGDAAPGTTIRYRLTMEGDVEEEDMVIEACERPSHLAVRADDDHGSWHLEFRLAEHDGTTELTFVHHLPAAAQAGQIGPGWEYYLDLLQWSMGERDPKPDFDDYYPSLQRYYEDRDA